MSIAAPGMLLPPHYEVSLLDQEELLFRVMLGQHNKPTEAAQCADGLNIKTDSLLDGWHESGKAHPSSE